MAQRRRSGPPKAVVLVIAALLVGCVAPGSTMRSAEPVDPLFVVPYRLDYGGAITVEAMVNGTGPWDFILDTGSTNTAVFENLAARIRLEPSRRDDQRVIGLAAIRALPSTPIAALRLGDARQAQFDAVVFPDWDSERDTPQGILGVDLLRDYVMVVDRDAAAIAFFDADAPPPPRIRRWRTARLQPSTFGRPVQPLYVTTASISNRPFSMLVDTGARHTIVNPALLARIPTVPPWSTRRSRAALVDVHDERARTTVLSFAALRAGEIRWRDRRALIIDSPFFEALGYDGAPFGVLGLDLLHDTSFAMDFRRHVLYRAPTHEQRPPRTCASAGRAPGAVDTESCTALTR